MRNKYGGKCYYCGEYVQPGDGFFEKIKGTKNSWRVIHADCVMKQREDKNDKKIRTSTKNFR